VQKDINARIYVLPIAAVIALYVLASLIVALARFPGPETDGKSGDRYRAVVTVPGPEAREPWVQDFVPWPYRDRIVAAQPGVASGKPITSKPNLGVKVAQVSGPRHHGIIGCAPSALPPRSKLPPGEITRF
jgi:hypothetical protein